MSLLAAFNVVMARHSGSRDIVLATPIATRSPRELEQLIGCFLNMLTLRTDLSGDPTFGELVARVKDTCLDAYAHQSLPFERLVLETSPTRSRSHQPIAQVAFSLQNTPVSQLELPGLQVQFHKLDTGRARMDLSVWITESPDGLVGELEYDTELFDPSWVRMLGDDLIRTIQAVTADPDVALSTVPAADPHTLRSLLHTWNDTDVDFGTEHLIHRIFEQQARRTPDATAVLSGSESITYGELDADANRLARRLRRLGVGEEVPVAVCLPRSIREAVAILAILKARGVYLPINPRDPHVRRDALLDEVEPALVLSAGELADDVWSPGRRVVDLDEEWDVISTEDASVLDVAVDPDNLAYILFTSGSTGRPKGVMVPHRGFCNRMLWGQRNHRLTSVDRVLRKAACTFDVSLDELFRALFDGAASVMMPDDQAFDPRSVAQVIERHGVTDVDFSPTALRELLNSEHVAQCRSLTRIVSGVEELSADLAQLVHHHLDVSLFNLYGPTETSVSCTARACPPHEDRRVVPIGRPMANMRVYILDEFMRPVPVGATGELYVAGVGLARGYRMRPDLTAASFVPDPFANRPGARLYRTGDHGRFAADGEIEFRGRVDSQLNFRGYRIEPGEIETQLCEVPGISAAAVIALTDGSGDSRLVAYLVAEGVPLDPAELRSVLRQRLPGHMIPATFVWLDALPLTAHGKLDHRALPEPLDPSGPRDGDDQARWTHEERVLVRIWRAALSTEQVGIHDDFFDLGGDSITATRILAQARQELGRDVEVAAIFDHPTVRELAQRFAA